MGRFEDLIEQAKTGDADALDALASEFSGSSLREKAESAIAWESKYQENLPLIRQARFAELSGQLDDDLRESGLNVSDLGEIDPSDMNLELIQGKARERMESRNAQKLATAKEAGFETVEEFETALETAKQSQAKRVQTMEAISGGVASSGGEPGSQTEPTLADTAQEAFTSAKQQGRTDDVALAAGIDAILSAQVSEEA
jgi:hypothetical protein